LYSHISRASRIAGVKVHCGAPYCAALDVVAEAAEVLASSTVGEGIGKEISEPKIKR
jgi:Zn finger protein HypA/HybF involved in hydrogenase expression